MSAAFVNPDGSTALVVHNEYDDPRIIAIAVGDQPPRLHAARWLARDLHLARLADLTSGTRLVDPWTTSMTSNVGDPAIAASATDDDGATAVDLRDRPGARPVGAGRPRSPAARSAGSYWTPVRRRTATPTTSSRRPTIHAAIGSRSAATGELDRRPRRRGHRSADHVEDPAQPDPLRPRHPHPSRQSALGGCRSEGVSADVSFPITHLPPGNEGHDD